MIESIDAIVMDLDGVIVDNASELKKYFVDSDPKDFNKFRERMPFFKPNKWAIDLLRRYEAAARIIVTAREAVLNVTYPTITWLGYHAIPFDRIHFKRNTLMSDEDYKEQTYLEQIKPEHQVLFAIDDNPNVVEMWLRNGVTGLYLKTDSYSIGDKKENA